MGGGTAPHSESHSGVTHQSTAVLNDALEALGIIDALLRSVKARAAMNVVSEVPLDSSPADLSQVLHVALPKRHAGARADVIRNDEVAVDGWIEVASRGATATAMGTSEVVVHSSRRGDKLGHAKKRGRWSVEIPKMDFMFYRGGLLELLGLLGPNF